MTTLAELQALRSQGVSSLNQAIALLLIRQERKTLSDLAVDLGVSNAGATVLADKLESLGLAKRAYIFEDRRVTYLEPTP